MNKIMNYLLQGLLYTAPLGITVYVIYMVFNLINDLSKQLVGYFFDTTIPGLGLVMIVFFLFIIGFLGKTIIANPLKTVFKKIIGKIPLLDFVYGSLNDLFSAFVGKDKKFNKPVLVLVNKETGLEKLGFLTEDNLSALALKDKVAVYFPHSYNFSGELFITDASNVKSIKADASDVMKFIVSGGVASWD